MNKILSILTCTLHKRNYIFKKLCDALEEQIKFLHQVELLANLDSGKKTIGQKRNELLCAAKGEYVAFVDDDDFISTDYISSILTAINYKKPDCCGIEGKIFLNKKLNKKFVHSIKYQNWSEENNIYYRCPNHLNPIKKKLALAVGFKNLNSGEDHDFSERIKPLLKTEVYINKCLYFYYPSVKI
jgi:glycosyltransferase involved in cell wall biosynthesis